jgi:hypothetical protein
MTDQSGRHRDMLRKAVLAHGGVWTSARATTLIRDLWTKRPITNGYGRDLLTDLEGEGLLVRTGRSRWSLSEAAEQQRPQAMRESFTGEFLRRCKRLMEIRGGLEEGAITSVTASIGVRGEMEPNRDYPVWIEIDGAAPSLREFPTATFEGGDPLERLITALDVVD